MDVRSDRVDMMLDIVDLTSYIKWCDVIKSGCDVICSSNDVIHMPSVVSSTQNIVISHLVDIMS